MLYQLVVLARLVKIPEDAQNSCGRANFHYFLWKVNNSISASKCPITTPKIRTWSLLLSKFSYHTHRLLNGGRSRLWARLPRSGHNPVGGVGEGGVSFRQLILITWPQAVQRMLGVGRGEGGGWGRGVTWSRKHPIATHIPLSPCLSVRCVSGGGSIKNFAHGRAEQLVFSSLWTAGLPPWTKELYLCTVAALPSLWPLEIT